MLLNTDRLLELNANAGTGIGADEFRFFLLYYLIRVVLLFRAHDVLNDDILIQSVHVKDARIGAGHNGLVGKELEEFDVSFDDLGRGDNGVLVANNVTLGDRVIVLNM